MDPTCVPHLVKSLYGLLMLLPQSPAFHTLQTRLHCVQTLLILKTASIKLHDHHENHVHDRPDRAMTDQDQNIVPIEVKRIGPFRDEMDFEAMLALFCETYNRHQKESAPAIRSKRQPEVATEHD
jgi:vacuole morphology and inheritance protein 14